MTHCTHHTLRPCLTPPYLPMRSTASALCLALLLAACGGTMDSEGDAGTTASAAALSMPPMSREATTASEPADYGARTRPGLYAQHEQALQLERQLRGDVVWVPVECCGTEGADLAVYIAYGMQAAHNLPASAPVFVSGADLRLAASVVNRLSDGGMSRVFLVTPPRTAAKPELR